MYTKLIFACVAIVLAASSRIIVSAAEPSPYEINVIESQTGAGAFVGQAVTKSLLLLETVVNREHGINGRPIKFVINDDASSPQVAVQLVSKLVAGNVPLILGPGISATCSATMPMALKDGPVMYCTSPAVYPPAGSYVFSAGPTTDVTTLVMVRYLRERGWKRVAVMSSTDAVGQAWDRGIQFAFAQAENKGVQLIANEHMNPADLTVAAQMARIKSANPQVVLVLPTGTPWGTAMRGLNDAGIDVPVIGGNGNISYAQLSQYSSFLPKSVYFAAGLPLVPSAIGPGPVAEAQMPYFKAFREAGIKPDALSYTAWDPAMLLITALRTLGPSASALQVRDFLAKEHGWAGLNGIYDFRDGTQRGVGAGSLVMVRYDKSSANFIPVSRPSGYVQK